MAKYIWFHPEFVRQTSDQFIKLRKENARDNGYTVLQENELDKVKAADHLTIVGRSISPMGEDDVGSHIQGEIAEQCVERLKAAGLCVAPKVLSLELSKAAVANGIAQNLSCQPFLKNTLIEANAGVIGRDFGIKGFKGQLDAFGRIVIDEESDCWSFFLRGKIVGNPQKHGSYVLQNILNSIKIPDFHQGFFSHYKDKAGWFGGRAGRQCISFSFSLSFFTRNEITLEKALLLANEKPDSATSAALDSVWEANKFGLN